ncbi:D-aminopeptidase [Chryseobacterium piperi]|uniref:D-aminopeptidase n=1 Tax=Chryseobacterium piperi TaxID=558152 RepID=A0A086BJ56_9FLAO|nr:P1 family peptidase [Chryseobacterium piperi]ASW76527.1 aminopeptidase [Chryseobacterium piperi]KFF28970.1 D-aminopeptidase [Chryseobacterium piperi]
MFKKLSISILAFACISVYSQKRVRELGISPGVLQPGKQNSITDVAGVLVGHKTLIKGDGVRTGVTAILPHNGNVFQQKVPAAIFVGNGFGKLAGSTQVMELGNLETPIVFTNTLNVSTGISALVNYTLQQKGNEKVQSVNAVVGETNDGWLNDIRGRHIQEQDVLDAIKQAGSSVMEGNVGAGTGTVCFGYKGGIGTSSRKLPQSLGGYTVGVLVQTNYGGVLQVDGVPVGKELKKFAFSNQLLNNVDGSCMIIIATDAPLDSRNLERLAARTMIGLGRTGGIASHGSGEYAIAFSTDLGTRVQHQPENPVANVPNLHNDYTSQLFMAAIEATEEAVLNSLTMATTMKGYQEHQIEALSLDKLQELLRKYNRIR